MRIGILSILICLIFSLVIPPYIYGQAEKSPEIPQQGSQPNPSSTFSPSYQRLRSASLVQDKNFYLLTLIENISAVRNILSQHEELTNAKQSSIKQLLEAINSCEFDIDCLVEAVRWDSISIQSISTLLREQYDSSPAFADMVDQHMRPSGLFQLYAKEESANMLTLAWEDAAKGMNRLMDVYAKGEPPRYPLIDSVTYEVNDNFYQRLIIAAARSVIDDTVKMELFFQPALSFALTLLTINHRDESARYEPLEAGENKAAYDYIPKINWDQYPYTLILVPGRSPIKDYIPLSPWAKLRLKLGVAQFEAGKAPLIVVSGGHVNPFQTDYCEAIEMKKYLMNHFGIPERAILVDPHARHTTTNMRNTARLMYTYGIPTDRKAIVTTSKGQSDYIEADFFTNRCLRELGYVPYTLYERLERHTQEFKPSIISLHADVTDPLDP